MKTYLFRTTTALKERDLKNYWLDSSIVSNIEIKAGSISAALVEFAKIVSDDFYINISKTALKNRKGMFVDKKDGSTVQAGYVISGKYEFDLDRGFVEKFIDLWIEIKEISAPASFIRRAV